MVLPADALPELPFQIGKPVCGVFRKLAQRDACPFGNDLRDQLRRDLVKDQRGVSLFRLEAGDEIFRRGVVIYYLA